jgi:hypothetical protein
MTKQLSLGFALVLSLATAGAFAEAPSAADLAEAGAPDSIYNKDLHAAAPANPETTPAQWRAAEAGDPDSIDSQTGAASARPPASAAVDEAQRRVAEAGNPNSVDSRLLPTFAILERVHAVGAGKLALARLAQDSGGASTAAYAAKLVETLSSVEQQIDDLANKRHVALAAPDDSRARNRLAADQASYQRLQQAKGEEFDRLFARQMNDEADTDAVEIMRGKSIDPEVSALLDQLLPVLANETQEARSLSISVCGADAC